MLPTTAWQSLDQIQEAFIEVARSIMLGHKLAYENASWDITALELYIYTKAWPDCTTHCADIQTQNGTWYVHCHKNGNFRSPQWCGIDITAGSQSVLTGEKTFAGILIRELDKVDGSATALQTILRGGYDGTRRRWSDIELSSINQLHGSKVTDGPLTLVPRRLPTKERLWIGPRKLPTKNPNAQAFKDADLRVATWETKVHRSRMRSID